MYMEKNEQLLSCLKTQWASADVWCMQQQLCLDLQINLQIWLVRYPNFWGVTKNAAMRQKSTADVVLFLITRYISPINTQYLTQMKDRGKGAMALADQTVNYFSSVFWLFFFPSTVTSSGHPPSLCHGPFCCSRKSKRTEGRRHRPGADESFVCVFLKCAYSQFLSMLDSVQQHDDLWGKKKHNCHCCCCFGRQS